MKRIILIIMTLLIAASGAWQLHWPSTLVLQIQTGDESHNKFAIIQRISYQGTTIQSPTETPIKTPTESPTETTTTETRRVASAEQRLELPINDWRTEKPDEVTVTIIHPLYKPKVLVFDREQLSFRTQQSVSLDCWCAADAYREAGLPFVDIRGHLNSVSDVYLPLVGELETTRQVHSNLGELYFYFSAARIQLGESATWSKEKADRARADYRREHTKLMHQINKHQATVKRSLKDSALN